MPALTIKDRPVSAEAEHSIPAQHSLAYRRDIDGLRAIAVLSVVMFHAAPGRMPGGFVGVDIFFVISGFLISTILLREMQDGRFTFTNFYIRRILRIFPPLLVVMTATLVAASLLFTPEDYRLLGKHIAAGAAFVSNLAMWAESGYFDSNADFKPLLHLWSLGVEEQFYIFWPLLLYAFHTRRTRTVAMVCAVGGLSFLANILQTGTNPVAAFYSPVPRFWELLMGCTVALSINSLRGRRFANVASAAGLALLVVALVVIDKQKAFPGMWAVLPTLGAALIIWAGPAALCNRLLLSNRLLVGIGLISYSLYLWHWPLLALLRSVAGTEVSQSLRAAAVLCALILAALSYKFLEGPIRARARTSGVATTAILAAFMALLAAAGLAINRVDAETWRPLQPRVVNTGNIGHERFFESIKKTSYPCLPLEIQLISDTWNGLARCFQSKPQDAQTVAILGDSHAEHLFPGIGDGMKNSNVVFYGMDGLPFTSNKDFSPVFAHIGRSATISTVILSAAWDRKLHKADQAKWKSELQATTDALVAQGKRVYLVADVHSFSFAPNVCKYDGRLWIKNQCSESGRPSEYMGTFEELSEANPSIRAISLNDAFCSGDRCYMARDGKLLYRDEHHLTVEGSALAATAILRGMSH